MSYILEALKKSQQLRELGQVPKLDTIAVLADEQEPRSAPPWGLLAVSLAALAVVIALYAVVREPPAAPPVIVQPAPSVEAPAAATLVPPWPELSFDASRMPLAGPPAALARGAPVEAIEPPVAVVPAVPPARPADTQPPLAPAPAPPARVTRPPGGQASLPSDLVEDVEAFKQQVRREQGLPPPGGERRAALDLPADVTRLRLTPQQQARIPGYLMTVHVHDEVPTRRFVVINGLRYLEGENTREGFWVERIIPDGAVLSYDGSAFFVRR